MKKKKIPAIRDELERDIKALIYDLEEETGLTVDSVELIRKPHYTPLKKEHRTLEKIKTEISLI